MHDQDRLIQPRPGNAPHPVDLLHGTNAGGSRTSNSLKLKVKQDELFSASWDLELCGRT